MFGSQFKLKVEDPSAEPKIWDLIEHYLKNWADFVVSNSDFDDYF